MTKSGVRSLPNAIIIGANKCGTTSLFYYLSLHPEISASAVKEPGFFAHEEVWNRGVEWYRSLFPEPRRIRLEASTCYTFFPEHSSVVQRMHSLLPDAKLIYLVRDPLERILSNYLQHVDIGIETRPFAECVQTLESNLYVTRSCYGLQLAQYLPFYSLERILVVQAEELLRDQPGTLQRIFRFLEVDSRFQSLRFHVKMNRSSLKRKIRPNYHPPPGARLLQRISLPIYGLVERAWKLPRSQPLERPRYTDAQRQQLIRFLHDDTKHLRKLTGQEFPGWSL